MAMDVPFEFVLEELSGLEVRTRPMFGCLAIYVGDKIVFIQRLKVKSDRDNGLWLATEMEHHASLRTIFPNMRSIEVFGPGVTSWQVLPLDGDDFEASALGACELVRSGDPRVGKVPKTRVARGLKSKSKAVKKKVSKKKKSPKRRQ